MTAAYLTVDLDALLQNWRFFESKFKGEGGGALTGAVLKADAYGLGAAEVGKVLQKAGCQLFFVAHASEGVLLRQALGTDRADIVVFHGCRPGEEGLFTAHYLIPVLNSMPDIEAWSEICQNSGCRPAVLHVDTGMNRLGLEEPEFQALLQCDDLIERIDFRMIMTHLAVADEPDHPMNGQQKLKFDALMRQRPPSLIKVPLSMANSAGVLNGLDYHYDIARVGIGLYGGNPFHGLPNPCCSVAGLEAEILQVRDIAVGETVSYGARFVAETPTRVATIAFGYADGLFRPSEGGLCAAINGKVVPVIGRITMDMIMLDVSALGRNEIQPGQRVELMGPHVSIDAVAKASGTIAYEVLTSFGRHFNSGRLERRYQMPG